MDEPWLKSPAQASSKGIFQKQTEQQMEKVEVKIQEEKTKSCESILFKVC